MGILQKARQVLDQFNPSNFMLVDRKEYNNVYGNYEGILKTWDQNYQLDNSRPTLPLPYLDTPSGSKIQIWRLSPLKIYDISTEVGDFRLVLETIQREMFRNGWEIVPKFMFKCGKCFKTFDNKPLKKFKSLEEQMSGVKKDDGKEDLECDSCGNTDEWIKPDPEHRRTLETLMNIEINDNNQKLWDLGRIYERDLDIVDNGYLLISKEYMLKVLPEPDPATGAIMEIDDKLTKINEFIRMHPINVTMIANSEGRLGYDNNNDPVWICPDYRHRTKRLKAPVCDICGCKAINAILESNNVPYGLPIGDPKKMMYARDEMVWTPGKYMPDLLYGYSPVLSIWKKAMSLFHQDEYIWKYFDKDRPPKSLLAIGSRNYESISAFMERQKQGARSDPYMPRPISINAEDVAKAVSFIDLTPNFSELQLIEFRRELRQIIMAMYGVSPVSSGEMKSSGLGNQGLELTLQSRAMEWHQSIFNTTFFDQITTRIYKIDDWKVQLVAAEEIDELRDAQIKGEKIKNAMALYSAGFEIWKDGNDEIVTSQFPNPELQQNNMMGGKTGEMKSMQPGQKQEKATNFEGEPLKNRPSDKGGTDGGSPSSGFSHSNKALSGDLAKVVDIINKGLINNWTLTTMAKRVSEAIRCSENEALDTIKYLVEASMEQSLSKAISGELLGDKLMKKYTIKEVAPNEREVTINYVGNSEAK